ncbi:MAG: Fic family protein [archaeon]|nr:Fic family protein [archaeon]
MVYHEIREVNGKKQNYLIFNSREDGKWVKKSKFIGSGNIPKAEIEKLKKDFEMGIIYNITSENLSKEQIIEIEKLRQIYNEKINSLNKEEFEKFQNTFFTELTYDSNAIEGSSLSLEDTNLIVNEGLVPEGKTLREINEAKNHINAINFLQSYKGDITELFILKLHSLILKDISEKFAGRYRENPVRIFKRDVRFPDYEKVPQLVNNLIHWYKINKTKMYPFELAVIFSVKLVSIHPFIDGNGRISRLMMNFLLKKKNYPWINIYMKQRSEYLKAVRQANEENYKPILEFCIKSLKENLVSFEIK